MVIDTELTGDEETLFLLMLGMATATVAREMPNHIDEVIKLINKLMAKNPNFTPYTTSAKG